MLPEGTKPLGDPNAGGPIAGPDDRAPGAVARPRPLLVRLLPMLIVIVALGGFGGIVGYYYFAGSAGGSTAETVAPLIKADQRPVRVRPENPGGMEVPHQDKEIYDRVGNRGTPPATAERLLPPPEAPMARPQTPSATSALPTTAGAQAAPAPGTMAAAPPRPAGSPPPQQPNVPPSPDVAPPAPSTVTSQAVIPPPATPTTPLPGTRPPAAPAPVAAATPPPAAMPSRPGASRVVLASVQSEPDARREWERLRRAHGDALAGMAPEFLRTDLGDRGVFWRIYIGPPEAAPDAQARCAALKQRQVNCFVARP
jgi:hypothetical protein